MRRALCLWGLLCRPRPGITDRWSFAWECRRCATVHKGELGRRVRR